ncbi:hypothetical protein SPFM12_00149 [Salmonella phage SPFM12]|nr:hypothetical protein SPFM12_00149 [Salmonella phage SPFM12]
MKDGDKMIDNVEVTYGVKDPDMIDLLLKMSAAEAKAFMKRNLFSKSEIKPIVETTAKHKTRRAKSRQSTCNLQKKEYPMPRGCLSNTSPAFRKRSTLII